MSKSPTAIMDVTTTSKQILCRGDQGREAAMKRLEDPGHVCDVCGAEDGECADDPPNMAQCAPENADMYAPSQLWNEGFCGRMCCYDDKCFDKFVGKEIPETAHIQCVICVEYYNNPMDSY